MGSVLALMLWGQVSHVRLLIWLALVTLGYGVAGWVLYRLFQRTDPGGIGDICLPEIDDDSDSDG